MDGLVPMQDEILKELRAAFDFLDPFGTGKITTKQLGGVLRNMGLYPTEAELYDMVDEIDLDGDGEIDFIEFQMMMAKRYDSINKEENLMAAFKIFDRDGDGYISPLELRTVIHSLGERISDDELDDMLREIDTDRDGRISYKEFVNAVLN